MFEEILESEIQVEKLYFEFDSEPYAVERDGKIKSLFKEKDLEVEDFPGHNLFVSFFHPRDSFLLFYHVLFWLWSFLVFLIFFVG